MAHCKAAGDFLANEDIGVIHYGKMQRARQSAECIASQHKTKVEMVEDPLVIDISWGIWEGKTYLEAFGGLGELKSFLNHSSKESYPEKYF